MLVGKRQALRYLIEQQQKLLNKINDLSEVIGEMFMLDQTTQDKLNALGDLETKIGTGIDTLVTSGKAALDADQAVIDAQAAQIATLQAQAGVDDAAIAADQAEIDRLAAAQAAAVSEFNAGVDTVAAQAQAVADHLSTLTGAPAAAGNARVGPA